MELHHNEVLAKWKADTTSWFVFKLYRTVYRATSNMRRILRSLAIKEQNKKMNCVIDRSNMKHSARNAKYELKYQAYYLFIPSLATQKHLNTTQHPANSN